MTEDSTLRKVVVRTRDGQVIPGFARHEAPDSEVTIITREGNEQAFAIKDVKAVFSVKDFKGSPEYEEVKFLNKQRPSGMVWVRAEFFDGEVLEGKIRNNMKLLSSAGFYLWPSDSDTNNDCVYVIKASLKSFTVLFPV